MLGGLPAASGVATGSSYRVLRQIQFYYSFRCLVKRNLTPIALARLVTACAAERPQPLSPGFLGLHAQELTGRFGRNDIAALRRIDVDRLTLGRRPWLPRLLFHIFSSARWP